MTPVSHDDRLRVVGLTPVTLSVIIGLGAIEFLALIGLAGQPGQQIEWALLGLVDAAIVLVVYTLMVQPHEVRILPEGVEFRSIYGVELVPWRSMTLPPVSFGIFGGEIRYRNRNGFSDGMSVTRRVLQAVISARGSHREVAETPKK